MAIEAATDGRWQHDASVGSLSGIHQAIFWIIYDYLQWMKSLDIWILRWNIPNVTLYMILPLDLGSIIVHALGVPMTQAPEAESLVIILSKTW